MKKLIIFFLACMATTLLFAQKPRVKTGKPAAKKEAREAVNGRQNPDSRQRDNAIWEGTQGPKPSKNQPATVRAAFAKDYPRATAVSWSKYRGDWTATFNNGLFRSVAVYHANGQRKDTRTVVQKTQTPKIILDDILKKRPAVQLGDIIKIELPGAVSNIFRVKTIEAGVPHFNFYDAGGKQVQYDY